MAQRITLASSKGGTGKTTTALHLAVAFAERGRRTVLVDLDPQGAIGLFLGQSDSGWGGLAEILVGAAAARDVVVPTSLPNLGILPRGRLDPIDVCDYELELYRPGRIAEILNAVEGDADITILDTPSGLGPVTRSALSAAHWVLVPLQAEPVALRAVSQTLRVVDHVRSTDNPALRLLGILPTMVALGDDTSLNVMGSLWTGFGGVTDTVIPRAEVFARSTEAGIPVGFLGGRMPPEARRFAMLADELEARMTEGVGGVDERQQRRLV